MNDIAREFVAPAAFVALREYKAGTMSVIGACAPVGLAHDHTP